GMLQAGATQVQRVDWVRVGFPGTDKGLGPAYNLDSCGGCHAQPASGGSSPKLNPQVAVASKAGATNSIPAFIRPDGPVREVRFKRNPDGSPDGRVHPLFTITRRTDAPRSHPPHPHLT